MSNRILKIGTRDSALAMWQAEKVQSLLAAKDIETELMPVKSTGDLDLVTPLYAMGVQGVFTKNLDAHLLSGTIDIAVHSYKDVPTQLAQGIVKAAVLERASPLDILVLNPKYWDKKDDQWHWSRADATNYLIGTGSVRRRAQWLHKYPESILENLRGNVQTRMRKLEENDWDGAIFAEAGLDRVELKNENFQHLDWMLSAPAQGAIVIVVRGNDPEAFELCALLNDANTDVATQIERTFLSGLMGGCSTPISAFAKIENEEIHFQGNILSPDGKHKMEIEKHVSIDQAETIGKAAAEELLQTGALDIIKEIRQFEKGN